MRIMFFEYWFMFPLSIVVATLAMTFGIGGATFFAPVFLLLFPLVKVTPLTPADAFGAALLTELAGFSSGLSSYIKRKTIDFETAKYYLLLSIPLAIIGTFLKRIVEGKYLIGIFAFVIIVLAFFILLANKEKANADQICFLHGYKKNKVIKDYKGEEHYVCLNHDNFGLVSTGIGGLFTGMISVGIGESVISNLRGRFKLPMPVAAGTSVVVVVTVVLVSSATDVVLAGVNSIPWGLLLFTIPGVIIGGQIGGKLSSFIPKEMVERILVGIFFGIGVFMFLITLTKFNIIRL